MRIGIAAIFVGYALAWPSAGEAQDAAGSTALSAQPAVHIDIDCAALSADAEQQAAFEARALVELAVRRRAASALALRCDGEVARLTWTSAYGIASTAVAVKADRKLFTDALIAALWTLKVEAQPELREAPAIVEEPKTDDALRFSSSAGVHVELWPSSMQTFPGARVGIALRGPRWSIGALGTMSLGLQEVDGVEARLWGGGIAFDARPFALREVELGVGGRVFSFTAHARDAVAPRSGSALVVSVVARARWVQEWSSFFIAFGPELSAYVLRPSVIVGEQRVWSGAWLAPGVALDAGWVFR